MHTNEIERIRFINIPRRLIAAYYINPIARNLFIDGWINPEGNNST